MRKRRKKEGGEKDRKREGKNTARREQWKRKSCGLSRKEQGKRLEEYIEEGRQKWALNCVYVENWRAGISPADFLREITSVGKSEIFICRDGGSQEHWVWGRNTSSTWSRSIAVHHVHTPSHKHGQSTYQHVFGRRQETREARINQRKQRDNMQLQIFFYLNIKKTKQTYFMATRKVFEAWLNRVWMLNELN